MKEYNNEVKKDNKDHSVIDGKDHSPIERSKCPKCGDGYDKGVVITAHNRKLEVCEDCSFDDKMNEWLLKVYKGGDIIS